MGCCESFTALHIWYNQRPRYHETRRSKTKDTQGENRVAPASTRRGSATPIQHIKGGSLDRAATLHTPRTPDPAYDLCRTAAGLALHLRRHQPLSGDRGPQLRDQAPAGYRQTGSFDTARTLRDR